MDACGDQGRQQSHCGVVHACPRGAETSGSINVVFSAQVFDGFGYVCGVDGPPGLRVIVRQCSGAQAAHANSARYDVRMHGYTC